MDGNRRIIALCGMTIVGAFLIPGCVGIPAQLLYVIYGNKTPAEYAGLKDKKVAVVCVSDASAYGPNSLTYEVERQVAARLLKNVPKITIVPHSAVDNWKDQNGWDETEFVQIGRGVGADAVLAIEVSSYSLHEGQTMYKGHVTVTSTVYDVTQKSIAFRKGPEDYEFPKSGFPSLQQNEREFERYFLDKLCEYLSRRFYEYEKVDGIAEDASM
jgi:hypothetical protein